MMYDNYHSPGVDRSNSPWKPEMSDEISDDDWNDIQILFTRRVIASLSDPGLSRLLINKKSTSQSSLKVTLGSRKYIHVGRNKFLLEKHRTRNKISKLFQGLISNNQFPANTLISHRGYNEENDGQLDFRFHGTLDEMNTPGRTVNKTRNWTD